MIKLKRLLKLHSVKSTKLPVPYSIFVKFSWLSPFGKIIGERGFFSRVNYTVRHEIVCVTSFLYETNFCFRLTSDQSSTQNSSQQEYRNIKEGQTRRHIRLNNPHKNL